MLMNLRMVQGNVGQLVLCLYLIPFLQVVLYWLEIFYESFLVTISEVAPAKWRIMVNFCLKNILLIVIATYFF